MRYFLWTILSLVITLFATRVSAAAFTVNNGQILDPTGKAFFARGINIYDAQMSAVCATSACTPLLNLFPKLNMVRLNVYAYNPPSYYQTFVSRLTALGIVVEIENHAGPTGTGGNSGAWTGTALASETKWYASLASAFASNPYVWFGTLNEPSGTVAAIVAEQVATYNAIRATGSKTIVMLDQFGGYSVSGFARSAFANMTGVVWDTHFYGWIPKYVSNTSTIASALAGQVASAQAITSADGVIPVIIGEYGNSTDGTNIDANGMLIVAAVEKSAYGSLAWHYAPGSAGDVLTTAQSKLTTPLGVTVAAFINSGPGASPPVTTGKTGMAISQIPASSSAPPPIILPGWVKLPVVRH